MLDPRACAEPQSHRNPALWLAVLCLSVSLLHLYFQLESLSKHPFLGAQHPHLNESLCAGDVEALSHLDEVRIHRSRGL